MHGPYTSSHCSTEPSAKKAQTDWVFIGIIGGASVGGMELIIVLLGPSHSDCRNSTCCTVCVLGKAGASGVQEAAYEDLFDEFGC
jgi:hypothetical protein